MVYNSPSLKEDKAGINLEAETEAKLTEECCLLACSAHLPGTAHSVVCPSVSINKHEYVPQTCPQINMIEELTN